MTLAEVYTFREDWHQAACASPLIRQYQVALDAALRHRPELQVCAVACRHCGIRFLTHPRNACRKDLRCPFGCRKHHSRQSANARSRLHSQSDSAKRKKKRLNAKRSPCGCETQIVSARDDRGLAVSVEKSTTAELVNIVGDDAGSWESLPEQEHVEKQVVTVVELPLELSLELSIKGCVLDEDTLVTSSVLPYLQMVASLILQRTVSREELLTRLRRHMRQHSIGRLSRGGYVLPYVNKHPP